MISLVEPSIEARGVQQPSSPDLDIWRAAQLMVKRYGEDAAIPAGMRADELLAEGDVDAAAT